MTKLSYDQLIEKLQHEKVRAPKHWDQFLNPETNCDFHLLELEFGSEKPMSERLGILTESFPSPEELEDDEIKTIITMILEVWEHYHYVADFPTGLPYRTAYEALLSIWDEPVMCLASGHFHFDFYEMELEQYVKSY